MMAVVEAREPNAKDLSSLQPSLVQHFELIATAPGGVAKLRELILTLAVRGKLVPQDPSDEPASELLKKIRAEKERLIAIGSLKKEKRTTSQTDEDLLAFLPRGWEACRLSQLILSIRSGGTPSKQNSEYWDGDIPWASVKDLKFGEPISDTQDKITKAGLAAGSELAPAGSILICTRMGLGKIGEALVDIAINQDLKAVQLGIGVNKQYFINYFKTLPMLGSGMTVAGIKQDELLSFVVPLPPAAEQARIVTRVEELMRLCDALEAKGQLAAAQHAQLVQTLLGALTASTSPNELADNWQRVATHFDSLLDRPEAIDALEQTILQLAVRGLLVPQDPKDEPASELLKKIRAEKDRLIAEGKIKRDKPSSPISLNEAPFALQPGWEWARLGQLSEIKGGKRLPAGHSFSEERTPYAYIQVTNMKDGSIATDHLKYLRPETYAAIRNYTISQEDIYITIAGTIGQVGEVPAKCHMMNLTENAAKIVFSALNKRWLRDVLSSKTCQSQFIEKTVQQAQPKLALHRIADSLVPVPPLAEQARIVAKVESLRRLCADLRLRLSARKTTQAQLAEALVASVSH